MTCTPEHPLYVQGQGWVEAGSLGIGTSIVSRAGPALQVTDLTWEKNKAQELAAGTGSRFGGYTVYNLTVEDDHTFFVGTANGGTWVHNSCRPDYHHIFPAFRGNANYGGWFKRNGINPNAFTVPMDTPYLKWLHDDYIHGYRGGIWNKEWRDFIDAEPANGYSMEDIWTQARSMMDNYGIPGNWHPFR